MKIICFKSAEKTSRLVNLLCNRYGCIRMTTHNLKTWKSFFEAVISGEKSFEMRKNDRGFKVGDTLNLIEVDPENEMRPTGRTCQKEITFILSDRQWGLEPGYVVLSLKPVKSIR